MVALFGFRIQKRSEEQVNPQAPATILTIYRSGYRTPSGGAQQGASLGF